MAIRYHLQPGQVKVRGLGVAPEPARRISRDPPRGRAARRAPGARRRWPAGRAAVAPRCARPAGPLRRRGRSPPAVSEQEPHAAARSRPYASRWSAPPLPCAEPAAMRDARSRGLAQAGVQALHAGRAREVGGVAGQPHPVPPEGWRRGAARSAPRSTSRAPRRAGSNQGARSRSSSRDAGLVEVGEELLAHRVVSRLLKRSSALDLGGLELEAPARAAPGQRPERAHRRLVEHEAHLVARRPLAPHSKIGEGLGGAGLLERRAEGPPHERAVAVGAHHERGARRRSPCRPSTRCGPPRSPPTPSRAVHRGHDAVAARLEPGEAVAPAHLDPPLGEAPGEQALEGALGQREQEGKARVPLREAQRAALRSPSASTASVSSCRPSATASSARPSSVEEPERARVQREGVAVAGGAPLLVDHLDPEAALDEPERGEETGRPGADDQDVGPETTGHRQPPG